MMGENDDSDGGDDADDDDDDASMMMSVHRRSGFTVSTRQKEKDGDG